MRFAVVMVTMPPQHQFFQNKEQQDAEHRVFGAATLMSPIARQDIQNTAPSSAPMA
jgi:hypothetical protein